MILASSLLTFFFIAYWVKSSFNFATIRYESRINSVLTVFQYCINVYS